MRMSSQPRSFPYVIEKCKDIFDREPTLEIAMGAVIKFIIRNRCESQKYYFAKKWTITLWRILKKNFHFTGEIHSKTLSMKTQRKNIIKSGQKKSAYCIFSIENTRDNYFGVVFPILKKIDEKGENCILFTSYEVHHKKRSEIDALKNTSIIFFENISYSLNSYEIIKSFGDAVKLYKKMLKETKTEDIIEIEKKHRNQIMLRIEDILVLSKATYSFFSDKKCRFLFSVGNPHFAVIGKKYNIRTVMIQHGFFSTGETSNKFIDSQPNEISPNASDEIIVWGEHAKKQVQKIYNYNDSNRKIYVLGNPGYDIVVNTFVCKQRTKDFYEKLNLDYKKKTVVFFSGTHGIREDQPKERYLNPIFAMDKLYERLHSKINFLIKLHPHETKDHYEKHMKNFKKVIMIKNEVSLYDLHLYSDIAISIESTTALESMIFGVPTLQLSLSEHGVRADYYKYGASLLIKSEDELVDIIEKIVAGTYDLSELKKNQKNYLDMNLKNRGYATDIIVEHLLKNSVI